MNTNIKELSALNNACDELLAGKYILIDIKIKSILNVIDTDTKLKDIVSSYVSNYNFNDLYNTVMNNSFAAIQDEKQIISFVYNLLYRFSNKDIDFQEFLNTFYPDLDITIQIANFVNDIIIPFKQAVGNIFIKRHVIVESNEYQNNYYNKIKTVVNLILSNMDTYKLDINSKDEYTMLLNSLYNASDKSDKSLARVAISHETYTIFGSFLYFIVSITFISSPLRGGSTIITSILTFSSLNLDISSSALPTINSALSILFNLRFWIASEIASSTTSIP